MIEKKKRIIVGLSGGVDSAVAAWKLKDQGHEVIGVFMQNWDPDDEGCPSRDDLIDAIAVADILGIDIQVVNFSQEYKDKVFKFFLSEYESGRTPNPDVLCNSEIKFNIFLKHAIKMGGDLIATGHYAQIDEKDGMYRLLKAEDGTKDQSYFLHQLTQKQLSKTIFPIGKSFKRDVRQIAKNIGLPNHDKKDSTGICFIGDRSFRDFIGKYLPDNPGEIVTDKGETIGYHKGLMYYTLGQRQGLGIGGAGAPWYVVNKDMKKNILLVSQGRDNTHLLSDALIAKKPTWISGRAPNIHWVFNAKTRYSQIHAPCTIDKITENKFEIKFAEAQWAITPGQYAVVYESNVCIGGGTIESSFNCSEKS